MKVLITGYSAAGHTSFGRIIRDLWSRLASTGKIQVAQHGWFHQKTVEDGNVPFEILPTNVGYNEEGQPMLHDADRYGAKSLPRIIHQAKPDIVWCLADPYMIGHLPELKRKFKFKLVLWIPVDGDPFPLNYQEVLACADEVYGVTEWGAQKIETVSGRDAGCIYHGVDTEVFKPLGKKRIETIRKGALADKYAENLQVVGFVGKNQFRKMPWNLYPIQYYLRTGNWSWVYGPDVDSTVVLWPYDRTARKCLGKPEWLEGYDHEDAKPLNMRFWMHCFEQEGGINFRYAEETWQQAGEIIYSSNLDHVHGFSDAQMNDLYNLFDLYVSFSGGEGFCMPLIEAASAGTPVMFADYSGQAEVGQLVMGRSVPVNNFIVEHGSGIERHLVDIGSAVAAIYECLKDDHRLKEWGRESRMAACRHFDYDAISAQWMSVLQRIHSQDVRQIYGVQL